MGAETYLPLQLQVGFGHSVAWLGCAGAGDAGLDDRLDDSGQGRRRRQRPGPGRHRAGRAGTLVMAIPAVVRSRSLAYAFAGLGMGIVSPALFAVVLEDGDGPRGQSTSSIPLSRQVGAGLGTAVAGIVFLASLSDQAIQAAEKKGAHVPAVVPAARHTYIAAALLSAVGLVACHWLRREQRESVPAGADRAAA